MEISFENYFHFVGIFIGILSDKDSLKLGWKCKDRKSVQDFRSCVQNHSDPYIKRINLKSYKLRTHLSQYSMHQVILPEDGSVQSKRTLTNETLSLDPSFSYIICLFDKDFLMYVSNSLLVQRSCSIISPNTLYTGIEIKVKKNEILKENI